jgi:GLPGLI family protein
VKKQIATYFLAVLCCCVYRGMGQKIIGDCTITFKVSARGDSANTKNAIKNAYKKFYVRGGLSLTEVSFGNYLQSTIYNKNGNNIYVMSQIGDQKYLSILSEEAWAKQFDKYKNAKLQTLDDTLNIVGYTCKKMMVTLTDGTKINLYYTPELKTNVSENPYEFDGVNGLILRYEAEIDNKYKITYTASNIDFSPVPAAKFIIPKEGYRILDNDNL